MNKYRKEKFKDRAECFEWCADGMPIYNSDGDLDRFPKACLVSYVDAYWQDWHKAIEIVPEKRTIEVWVNVCEGSIYTYGSEARAMQNNSYSIGTIKLSKEITIVDGKVVENGK